MKKRRFLAGLLAVWPYLFGVVALLGEWEDGVIGYLALYMGLTAAVYILSAVNAWTWPVQGYRELASWNLATKLIHIPFYVCVFLIGLVMAGAMAVPALLLVSPMVIAMLWVVGILLMVTSSVYGAAERAHAHGPSGRAVGDELFVCAGRDRGDSAACDGQKNQGGEEKWIKSYSAARRCCWTAD